MWFQNEEVVQLNRTISKIRILRQMHGSASSNRRYTRTRAGNVFLFVFIGALGIFSMLPLIYAVFTSFKPIDELLIFPPRFFAHRPTLENYIVLPDLLSSLRVPLSRYIFNSLFITVFTTVVYIIISSMTAYVFAKSDLKGKNVMFMITQFALIFNGTTLGLSQFIILSKLNVVDTYFAYILPYLASTLGVFLIKQYMEGYVPDALLEAAKIDGAGYFKTFFGIVIPMIKPAWLTLALFAFRDVWAQVPSTVFSEDIKTLPMIMAQITAGGVARSGSAMAVTTILMIPPIAVYLITQSSVVDSMSSAGIKE